MNYIANENRYKDMKYHNCGKSGLKLPAISLGLWHNFGTNDNFENMQNMCRVAFDNGITHFDLANNYGPVPGSAEANFGKILNQDFASYRDELVVSTKAGYDMWEGPYGNFGSRKYILGSLDQSLWRMGLDYVDIFYHHRMDPDTDLAESMGALDSAVKQGKALYAGISNYDGKTLEKACEILKNLNCPFIINQNKYSIFDRTIEQNGLKKTASETKTGLIIFSPLEQGLLTDRYLKGIPEDSRIKSSGVFLKDTALTPKRLEQIKKLNDIAQERNQTLAQMSLSWLFKDKDVTSALIGASKPEQVLENISMMNNTVFSKQELDLIDAISQS